MSTAACQLQAVIPGDLFLSNRPGENLSRQTLADAQTVVPHGNDELSLVVVGDHVYLLFFAQAHGHQPHLGTLAPGKIFDDKSFPRFCIA